MTTSPARAAANAANAQLSTGPRTEDGKARSARNARKHGLTAKELIVHDDQRDEFEELQRGLLAEIDPQTTLESIAFRQLLHAAWNLQRFRRLEAALFFDGIDPVQNEATAAAVDRLTRYAARAERSYYRALTELRTLPAQPSIPEVANSPRQNEPNLAQPSAAPPAPGSWLPAPGSSPSSQVARNSPCPCGGGLKYKRCCGRTAPALLHAA